MENEPAMQKLSRMYRSMEVSVGGDQRASASAGPPIMIASVGRRSLEASLSHPTILTSFRLLTVLCFFAGCGGSQTKQEAKSGDSAAAQKQADSAARPKSAASELGFEHTWKPDAHVAPPVASKSLAMPVAAQSTTGDDDRYADVLPAPAVGARSTGLGPNPELSPPNGRTMSAEPPAPAQPTGNPLRDATSPAASGRPQDPPAVQSPPSSGDPIPAIPNAPPAAQGSDAKPGLSIPTKPAGTEAGPSLTPVTPPGEPKEHTLLNARPGPRTNKNSGIPFDPIKENGPIFVDWPKPKLALVITGMQAGYLEPCGCGAWNA